MSSNYIAPKNIEELCMVLKDKDDRTHIIAGGTDLIINLRKKGIIDYKIIDISKFQRFKTIDFQEDRIIIGSCVTMTELENNEEIKKYIPALTSAAYSLGSTQIRNKATIGGNLVNASQSGDTIPVLFAYDADVRIMNSSNEYRYEKASDFVSGIGQTSLRDDEIITSIIIKKSDSISAFSKIGSRKTVTISKINCCGKFDMGEEDRINNAIIYLGAVGVKPVRSDLIEKELIGFKLGQGLNDGMKKVIQLQIENAIPNRNSKHYKKVAAIGLIEDMLSQVRGDLRI